MPNPRSAARQMLRDAALLVPPLRRLHSSRATLLAQRDALQFQCQHLRASPPASPFHHYNASFDPIAVICRHAVPDPTPAPGFLTNFLGVRIDPKFYPGILQGRAGEVEPIPIPANWHADIAEWGAALRAVDLARDQFTAIELGCGWGCWLNNTGAAARRAGLAVHLIGIEGDEGHIGFAREALAANGFAPEQVTLLRGVAAATAGIALFPRQEQAGVAWGLAPIFGASEKQQQAAVQSGACDVLPMIPLDEVAAAHPRIDLLHIDIQGGEAEFIAGCLPAIQAKVAYLLVGTHSRQIEGRIMDILLPAGWHLEIERPCIFGLAGGRPEITVDGVQGWRNAALAPPDGR